MKAYERMKAFEYTKASRYPKGRADASVVQYKAKIDSINKSYIYRSAERKSCSEYAPQSAKRSIILDFEVAPGRSPQQFP